MKSFRRSLFALAAIPAALLADGVPPKPVRYAPPEYPVELARAHLTGRVTVDFVVTSDGEVRNPVVVSSNNPWFEHAALDAILQWKFEPAQMNGRKVNARARQLLEFRLDDRTGETGLWRTPARPKSAATLPPELRWEKPPEPVNTSFAVYPREALVAHTEGHVRLRFLVDAEGKVAEMRVDQATTPEFGRAAVAMLDEWRFTAPVNAQGFPCYAGIALELHFHPSGYGDVPVRRAGDEILGWLKKHPERIVNFADLDAPPQPLSRRQPVFPSALRPAGQGGRAEIDFFIDREGDVQLPAVVSASSPEFGFAAVQAVATWRFEPPRRAGKPVVTRVRIPIDFNLKPAPADPR